MSRLAGMPEAKRVQFWGVKVDSNPEIISELSRRPIEYSANVVDVWHGEEDSLKAKHKVRLKIEFTKAAEWTFKYRIDINLAPKKIRRDCVF